MKIWKTNVLQHFFKICHDITLPIHVNLAGILNIEKKYEYSKMNTSNIINYRLFSPTLLLKLTLPIALRNRIHGCWHWWV